MSAWVDGASWVCLVLGSLMCVVGGLGLLRLPDLYARAHGASLTDTLGAWLLLIGMMLQAGVGLVALKLLLILLFLVITSPAATHALAKAAYARGVVAAIEYKEPWRDDD